MTQTVMSAMLAAAGLIAAGAAYAQQPGSTRSREPDDGRGSYSDPFFGRQNGQICRRWCIEDRNPCDPPNFKVADGRCSADHD